MGRIGQRVYPRERGGTGRRLGLDAAAEGLSPRTRGNPAVPAVVQLESGSIPANAGEPRGSAWAVR